MIGLMCPKKLMWTKQILVLTLLVLSWDEFYISTFSLSWFSWFNAKRFNDVAIAFVKGNDNRIHFRYVIKDEAINTFKKCKFKWGKWNIIKHSNLLSRIRYG